MSPCCWWAVSGGDIVRWVGLGWIADRVSDWKRRWVLCQPAGVIVGGAIFQ